MAELSQLSSREALDTIIQRTIVIYRWAVTLTFAFVGIGFLITIFGDQNVDSVMGDPDTLFRQVMDLEASGFFGVGISIMILTPIIMIANAAYLFFRAGDKRYGLITSAVVAILLLSIVISYITG